VKRIFTLALAATIAVLAGGGTSGAAAEPPYELNAILSLTGGAAFLGTKEQPSLRALEMLVNSTGGIRGRELKIVVHDDGSNPQTAVQIATQLIAKKVPVILGPTLTADCGAVQGLVEKNGPVTYCYALPSIPQPGSYYFVQAPSLDDVVPALFKFAKSRNWKRIAIVTSTDASGQDFDRRVDRVIARPEFRELAIVEHQHFNITDPTVSAQMTRIKAAKPDVLMSFTVGTPFATLLRGINDAGLDLPVYASGGNMTYAQMEAYSAFLPKELYFNGNEGIVPDPDAKGAVKKAQQTYFDALKKAGVRPEFMTEIPWDPTMIIVDALRKLGPDATAQQIHTHIEGLRGWTGIEGTYDFTNHDQRGIGEPAVAFFRWDHAKKDFIMVPIGKR
jgi:branched-chain amino acid transport system substrate-binding protein